MVLADVNVLVCAHREDAEHHPLCGSWLQQTMDGGPFGVSDLVLSGCLRILTHPKVFSSPTPTATALRFLHQLRSHPNAVLIQPGRRHWDIFNDLCTHSGIKGNLVPDAFLAALAIESGCEWITFDRDYSRFPGLRWRVPG